MLFSLAASHHSFPSREKRSSSSAPHCSGLQTARASRVLLRRTLAFIASTSLWFASFLGRGYSVCLRHPPPLVFRLARWAHLTCALVMLFAFSLRSCKKSRQALAALRLLSSVLGFRLRTLSPAVGAPLAGARALHPPPTAFYHRQSLRVTSDACSRLFSRFFAL